MSIKFHLSDQLSHVHSTDHLLKGLSARVEASLIDRQVPFGPDEVELAVVAKTAPLCVYDHMPWIPTVAVPQLDVVNVLEVAGVGPGPDDQPDPTLAVLPSARHQTASGVIEDCAHLET